MSAFASLVPIPNPYQSLESMIIYIGTLFFQPLVNPIARSRLPSLSIISSSTNIWSWHELYGWYKYTTHTAGVVDVFKSGVQCVCRLKGLQQSIAELCYKNVKSKGTRLRRFGCSG